MTTCNAAISRASADPPPRAWQIYLSVLNFKSNDQNPTMHPPFRPPEGAQLKRPWREPSEPGVVWPLLPLGYASIRHTIRLSSH